MQVRLFYNDFCKDIPLDGKSKFSIGSGKNDGFCLSDSDLKKNHVVLTTQKNGWQIVCNGDTFLRGATLKKGPLQMSVTYVLSQQHRVSMICMDDSVLQVKSLNLGIDRDISVGRDQDTGWSTRHWLCTSRKLLLCGTFLTCICGVSPSVRLAEN